MRLFPLSRQSVVYFTLNMTVNCLTLYYLLYKDVLLLQQLVSLVRDTKPLFSVFLRAFVEYSELSLLVTSQLYLLHLGPNLIDLLNSPAFDSVKLYTSKAATVKIAALFIICVTITYLLSFSLQVSVQWARPLTLDTALALLVLYLICVNTYFYLHLLLYLQYGTGVVLRGLQAELSRLGGNSRRTRLTSVYFKLRQVALLNDRFLGLIAFPFSFFVFMNFSYFVCSWGVLTIFYTNFLNSLMILFYPIVTWTYFISLVLLNRHNLAHFEKLNKSLAKVSKLEELKSLVNQRRKKLVTSMRINFFQRELFANDVTQKSVYRFSSLNSELAQTYQRCFQLRFFNMIDADLRFILISALLALNFIVFLAQTK